MLLGVGEAHRHEPVNGSEKSPRRSTVGALVLQDLPLRVAALAIRGLKVVGDIEIVVGAAEDEAPVGLNTMIWEAKAT